MNEDPNSEFIRDWLNLDADHVSRETSEAGVQPANETGATSRLMFEALPSAKAGDGSDIDDSDRDGSDVDGARVHFGTESDISTTSPATASTRTSPDEQTAHEQEEPVTTESAEHGDVRVGDDRYLLDQRGMSSGVDSTMTITLATSDSRGIERASHDSIPTQSSPSDAGSTSPIAAVSRETLAQPNPRLSDEMARPDVSRETEHDAPTTNEMITSSIGFDAPHDRPAGLSDHETPIAREAAQAIEVRNVRQERWPSPARTRVLTVANQKGGVGKTTSAVNIAAALALHGLRVLLIDLDPQGNASTALGIEHGVGTPSIYDVLLGGQALGEVAQTTDFAPTLRCVPSTLDLAGADIELTSQVAREYRLQRALSTFLATEQADLDYVLIDCPPSLGLLTLNALVAAREVLLPIQCEYYALEGLAQLLKTVDLVNSHLNPDLVVTTVLLTMYDSRTRLADQVADEVRRHFGDLVLEPTIPRNVRVSEAPGFGQTVITYDPGSRGAIGYIQAAHEIAVRGARGEHETVGRADAGNGPTEVAEGDA